MKGTQEPQVRKVMFIVGETTKITTASALYCHELCKCLTRRGRHQMPRCENPNTSHILAEGPGGIHRCRECLGAEVFYMDEILEKRRAA
ncbi:MAG TPA: hypothetical protein PLV42_07095 [bacterium]|nr:hypothetical protein [bacterium]